MKKFLFLFIIVLIIFAGEFCSTPKSITDSTNDYNVWTVRHFFNLYSTEYTAPREDSTVVYVTGKRIDMGRYIVYFSDGTSIIDVTSKNIYNDVELNDTVILHYEYIPTSKSKYKIRYRIEK